MPKSLYIDPDKMRAEGKITFQDIPVNAYKKTIQEELDEGNFTKEDLIRLGDGGLCQMCSTCHYPNCSFGRY